MPYGILCFRDVRGLGHRVGDDQTMEVMESFVASVCLERTGSSAPGAWNRYPMIRGPSRLVSPSEPQLASNMSHLSEEAVVAAWFAGSERLANTCYRGCMRSRVVVVVVANQRYLTCGWRLILLRHNAEMLPYREENWEAVKVSACVVILEFEATYILEGLSQSEMLHLPIRPSANSCSHRFALQTESSAEVRYIAITQSVLWTHRHHLVHITSDF
jgi:hypothetical protein